MMARKGIPGLSFSWKRALGITAAKQRFARKTGIPTTRQGRHAKLGRNMMSLLGAIFTAVVSLVALGVSWACKKVAEKHKEKAENEAAMKEYQALKNISEGKPANLADITNPAYITKPPMTTDINAAPEEYKPQLTEYGRMALNYYEEQIRQDKR
jgi:hypothetical protein